MSSEQQCWSYYERLFHKLERFNSFSHPNLNMFCIILILSSDFINFCVNAILPLKEMGLNPLHQFYSFNEIRLNSFSLFLSDIHIIFLFWCLKTFGKIVVSSPYNCCLHLIYARSSCSFHRKKMGVTNFVCYKLTIVETLLGLSLGGSQKFSNWDLKVS